MHAALLWASLVGVTLGVVGCGSSSQDVSRNLGTGGTVGSGGSAAGQTGGSAAHPRASGGGSSPSTGGTVAGAGGASHSDLPTSGGTMVVGGSHSGNTAGTTHGVASSTTGKLATGGNGTGGTAGTGGVALGGTAAGATGGNAGNSAKVATGGALTTGGAQAVGGSATGVNSSTGGTATGGASTSSTKTPDPCSAPNTLSGGTPHCNQNQSGAYGTYEWEFWSNEPNGCLTTYDNPETFSVNWDESRDVLGMVGLVFDSTKPPEALGTFTADFAETHTGTAGDYSYIGVHGWTETPYVSFYIIDDSFDALPFKPWSSSKLTTYQADGGTYDVYYSRGGESKIITEIYSVRQASRRCGRISVSEHFSQWVNAGQVLGNLSEVRVFVEVGGGTGSIDFTTARVELE